MLVYLPKATKYPAVTGRDYPAGWQDIGPDDVVRAMLLAGIAGLESGGVAFQTAPNGTPTIITTNSAGQTVATVVPQGLQSLVSVDGNVVVGSAAAASANVAAINAILARRGKVEIQGLKGTLFINDSLVIGSNTSFKVPPDLEIKMTGGVAHALLVTEGYKRAVGTYEACTLAWTAGRTVTVTRAAHGLVKGDYVLMYSANLAPSNFIGVFPIKTVPDANTFTIQLHRTPSASPTGTAQYVLADKNVEVEGGIWNANHPNNTGSGPTDYIGVVLGAVAHVRARNLVFKELTKFGLQFGAVYDFRSDNISCQTSTSDTIKVYGPAVMGRIQNTAGWSGDDVVSIQAKEADPFSTYRWSWGDVHNITVEDTSGQTANGGTVTVYGSPNEYSGDITIRNAGGFGTSWGVALTAGFNGAVIDNITVDQINSGGTSTMRVNDNGYTGGVVNNIEVRGFNFEPDSYASNRQGFIANAGMSIGKISFENAHVNSAVWPSASMYMLQFNGPVGVAEFSGSFTGNGTNGRLASFTGGVRVVNIDKAVFSSNWSVVMDLATTGTPTVNVTSSDLGCFGAVVNTALATTVNLIGNRCSAAGNGIVRANAAVAITVKSAANTWVTNNSITNGGATGDWRVYGWDMPINLNTAGINKTVAGQHCFNTTLAGTLAANRLAHCNGTNFLQLDTPANVF